MATQKGRNWSSGDIVTAANLSSVERGVSAVSSLYEPTTWANGDTVTAAALNNIEQGIVNADGGGTSWTTLTEESVTVGGEGGSLTYNTQITADTIKVTFNGTEYTVSPSVDTSPFGTSYTYGAQFSEELDRYDYSTYPFSVVSTSNGANALHTETAGTYNIKIEAPQSGGSSDFSMAQVTVVNTKSFLATSTKLSVPMINPSSTIITSIFESTPECTDNILVVLYKDGTLIDISEFDAGTKFAVSGDAGTEFAVSGDAELVSRPVRGIRIFGDCTITISAGK